jgi:UDP-glucose 4-epimerase
VKVLVTGGAGFIGAHLCRRLVERGHEVAALDDLSTGFRANLDGLGATLHVGSVLDVDVVGELVAAADSVVHLAAAISVPDSVTDPVGTNEVNVTGTLNVLCAARDHAAHTVLASSAAVYGTSPEVPTHEELVPRPVSPYAVSKLATESYGLSFAANYQLPVIAFRFFNVYGPLQSPAHAYAAVVPAFVSALLDGRPLQVFGDGKQSRDFTSVSSLVAVLVDAVERRVAHDRPVNLAFGTSTTLLELIERLQRLTGLAATVEQREPRAGDVRVSQADTTLLRALFPLIVPQGLDDGLAETIGWFRATRGGQS